MLQQTMVGFERSWTFGMNAEAYEIAIHVSCHGESAIRTSDLHLGPTTSDMLIVDPLFAKLL
jgi:hypothetical protein